MIYRLYACNIICDNLWHMIKELVLFEIIWNPSQDSGSWSGQDWNIFLVLIYCSGPDNNQQIQTRLSHVPLPTVGSGGGGDMEERENEKFSRNCLEFTHTCIKCTSQRCLQIFVVATFIRKLVASVKMMLLRVVWVLKRKPHFLEPDIHQASSPFAGWKDRHPLAIRIPFQSHFKQTCKHSQFTIFLNRKLWKNKDMT